MKTSPGQRRLYANFAFMELMQLHSAKLVAESDGTLPDMAGGVLEFMIAMGQDPQHIKDISSPETYDLMNKLMGEEIEKEMWPAFFKLQEQWSLENLAEFADGAIDSIYVIIWTMLKLGLPVGKLFEEVQYTNMAKLQADGTCLKDELGKVQKPEDWKKPDIFGIIMREYGPQTYRASGMAEGS